MRGGRPSFLMVSYVELMVFFHSDLIQIIQLPEKLLREAAHAEVALTFGSHMEPDKYGKKRKVLDNTERQQQR